MSDLPEVTPNPPAHSDADFQARNAANVLAPHEKARLCVDVTKAGMIQGEPETVRDALAKALPFLEYAAHLLEEKARPEEGK